MGGVEGWKSQAIDETMIAAYSLAKGCADQFQLTITLFTTSPCLVALKGFPNSIIAIEWYLCNPQISGSRPWYLANKSTLLSIQ